MTIQSVILTTHSYGADPLSATLRNADTDALVATADSVTETNSGSGIYVAAFGEASVIAAGVYRLRAVAAGLPINRYVTLTGVDAEFATSRSDRHAELDSAALRVSLGMAAANLDSQLAAILAGGGGGSGTGARTVTITVNDGTTALQNAIVRLTEGVNTFTALTNASGVAVFNLADATYTVSISKSGYSYAGTTIIVNGTETATYSMTAIVITPGTANLTTAWLVARVAGVATADITIRYQQRQEPDADTGSSYDDTIYSVNSDADGLVEMPMVKGGYYYVWRGTGKRPEAAPLLLIPVAAGTTYELPSHVGR